MSVARKLLKQLTINEIRISGLARLLLFAPTVFKSVIWSLGAHFTPFVHNVK